MDTPFMRLEMLPARHGDCLLLQYGKGEDVHTILIDGGPDDCYPALKRRLATVDRLDMVMLTHIDGDHIGGILQMLCDRDLPLEFGDLWFNGWPQLDWPLLDQAPEPDRPGTRGVLQGAYLGLAMQRWQNRWNRSFDGLPIYVHDDGPLPALELDGGLKVTVLAPTARRLRELQTEWREVLRRKRLSPDDEAKLRKLMEADRRYRGAEPDEDASKAQVPHAAEAACKVDDSIANGSSIVLAVEFAGKRLLLLGDALTEDVTKALDRLERKMGEERHRFDAVKMSHHGSSGNVDAGLLARIDCPELLISTNGDSFHHPDVATLDLVRECAPAARLHFNYAAPTVRQWLAAHPDHAGSLDVPDPCNPGYALTLTS